MFGLELAHVDFGNVSGYAIGVMCFLAVMTGRLITRRHYQDTEARADKWEAAFWKSQEIIKEKDEQQAELLETARAMKHFMEAFPRAVGAEGEGR